MIGGDYFGQAYFGQGYAVGTTITVSLSDTALSEADALGLLVGRPLGDTTYVITDSIGNVIGPGLTDVALALSDSLSVVVITPVVPTPSPYFLGGLGGKGRARPRRRQRRQVRITLEDRTIRVREQVIAHHYTSERFRMEEEDVEALQMLGLI